jgi:hypothetical protein
MRIGTDLRVGLLHEVLQLGLRDALVFHAHLHREPKPSPSRGPMETAQVTLALLASSL